MLPRRTIERSGPPIGLHPGVLGPGIDQKYNCGICKRILREPVQTECGHRFCTACVKYFCETVTPPHCPPCTDEGEEPPQTLSATRMFPDPALVKEMSRLPASCPYTPCVWSGPFSAYTHHENECEFLPRPCPFGCEADRSQEHLREAVAEHTHILLAKIERLEETTRRSASSSSTAESEFGPRVEALWGRIENLKTEMETFQRRGGEAAPVPPGELMMLAEKQVKLEDIASVLFKESEGIAKRLAEMRVSDQEDSGRLDDAKNKMRRLERSIAVQEVTLAESSMRIQYLEQTSTDGTLVWRVTDVSRRRREAQLGDTQSLYSPAFHTARGGYKICLRLYLNGDGAARGGYLSLFFVIMRGEYNALLKWPFRQKVTFTLMNQDGRDSVVDAFRPDPSSNSFDRPSSDMNIASGLPNFCPLTRLDNPNTGLVKNDTMFIKCVVNEL